MYGMRIGELARRSGVSAKALRLYEARGLLRPDGHTPSGYRWYGTTAARQLQRIVLLRGAGFTLAEIGRLLATGVDLNVEVLDRRIAAAQAQLDAQTQALATLRRLRAHLHQTPSLDELLEHIHMSRPFEVPLTAAERAAFAERAADMGQAALDEAARAWPALIAEVRAAMDAGTPANDSAVRALAQRWQVLVQAASGGDRAVEQKIAQAWTAQPAQMAAMGLDPAMFRYIGAAMQTGN